MQDDLQHLKLLSIFHYVVGGMTALFACFPIIHLIIGLAMIIVPAAHGGQGQAAPMIVGWFFVLFAAAFILAGWTLAAGIALTGQYLGKRTHYLYCLVVAAVECIFMPFGTVLGVFTIIVLSKPTVKGLFSGAGA